MALLPSFRNNSIGLKTDQLENDKFHSNTTNWPVMDRQTTRRYLIEPNLPHWEPTFSRIAFDTIRL